MYGQISYWAFREGLSGQRSVVEAMRLAKEAGFGGIELCVAAAGDLTPDTPSQLCRDIAAQAKSIGIRIGSVASGLLWDANPASDDKATRQRAIEITLKSLRVTADLGAGALLVLPGMVDVFFKLDAEVVPYDECYERSVTFGKAVAASAGKLGVLACFENVWNRFLLSPLEFRGFIDEIGGPAAGVYFDLGNVWTYGYPQHWIKILGRRIKRVHVKDFKRAVGNVSGFCQLLDGDVPLAQGLKMLKTAGYKGPVTAEVFPGPADADENAFLRDVAGRMKKIMP
jgi:hexulose-6-phosphate isomerase